MEQHRVLIVILSLCLFIAVVLGAGLWLFYPRDEAAAPAIAEAPIDEEGRGFDPIEYLRGDEREPLGLEPETEESTELESDRDGEPADGEQADGDREPPDDDIIIVYGEPGGSDDARPTTVTEPTGEPATTRHPAPPSSGPGPAASRSGTSAGSRDTERTGETAAARDTGSPAARTQPPTTRESAPPTQRRAEPRVVSREEYWIQLISSPSLDTVEQARSRLNEWTISGLITSIKKDDTTFYRLRVGPYTEKAEAEKFLDWIRDIEGFGTSYISLVYNQRTVMN